MLKPARMREIICAHHPQFAHNPEQLEVYLKAGHIICAGRASPSYRYAYELHVLAMDFAGSLDDLVLPILIWAREQQPDLLLNPDQHQAGITFDADILNDNTIDVQFTLKVSEAVVVTRDPAGRWQQVHKADPLVEWQPAGEWVRLIEDMGVRR